MRFDRHDNGLWLPALPRFVAGGRKQSLLGVTNLIGLGGGISPPVLFRVGNTTSGASSSTIALASVTIPAGSLIIVMVASNTGTVLSSVADGTNTYTVDDASSGGAPMIAVASSPNCAALSGATITATFGTAAQPRMMTVWYASNAALTSPLDKKASASGTSTTPSATTAATTFNFTIVVGGVSSSGGPTITEDAAFTQDDTVNATVLQNFAHKTIQPTAVGAQTYAPTFSGSAGWRCLVAAYKGLA